jgi:hypothetical protein
VIFEVTVEGKAILDIGAPPGAPPSAYYSVELEQVGEYENHVFKLIPYQAAVMSSSNR